MNLIERVKTRLTNDEVIPEDNVINELILTVADRVNLLLGTDELPEQMNSVVVDAVIKMIRKQYYEGISSESSGSISTSFVDNILAEYSAEIEAYKFGRKKVRFI